MTKRLQSFNTFIFSGFVVLPHFEEFSRQLFVFFIFVLIVFDLRQSIVDAILTNN